MKISILLITLNAIIIIVTISKRMLSIGAILIVNSSIIAILISFFINSWYAFITFLIYVTGLLVIFGYFLALRPNSYQPLKKPLKRFFLITALRAIPLINYIQLPTFNIKIELDVTQIIYMENSPIYLLMVVVLLLILLIVVSLTYKSPSPLRNYMK